METPKVLAEPTGPLLKSVRASDVYSCSGAPWAIAVDTHDPTKTEVFINATPGPRRIMQFSGDAGEQTVAVMARHLDGTVDSTLVKLEVKDCGLVVPQIATSLSRADAREMHFTVTNAKDLGPATSFEWKLHDGTSATTAYPTWTYRFDPKQIEWLDPATPFVVTVTARRSSGDVSAMRTFTARPTYALTRARGVIQPPVSFDPLAWEEGLELTNVEATEKLHIKTRRLTLWHCEMAPPKELDPEPFYADVDAGETRHFTFDALAGEKKGWDSQEEVCGLGVHLAGNTSDDVPVEAHAYVELAEVHWRVERVRDPAIVAMLRQATASGLWPETQEELTQRDVWRLAREGRLDATVGSVPPDDLAESWRPLRDDFRCDPGDPGATPPVTGWECQPTDRFEQSLPYVANAHAGDFALSAGCGMIGQLLRQLSPAQRFSHTGVFTRSQDRIRHSTAVEDRLAAGADFGGLDERNLRYPQPGVLTQNVAGAYIGEPWIDAEGRPWVIDAFNDELQRCNGDADATPPTLIRWTHDEADALVMEDFVNDAMDMAGHYRFFSYSDGSIGMDAAYDDPLGVPGADGRNRATVCSSFLWTAAQEAGMTLEAICEDPTGCEAGGVEARDRLGCSGAGFGLGCADVDGSTMDGLYLYGADERLAAGESIYSAVRSAARDGFLSGTFFGVPNRVANQVSNCFATDGCTRSDDTDAWQDAEVGRAISPDDLLFWDRPFGASEPLIERQGLFRRVYTWQPPGASGEEGEALVTVFGPDGELVDGATVELAGVSIDRTAADGTSLFSPVPVGSHAIVAGRLFDDRYYEGHALVEVLAGERSSVEVHLGQWVPVDPTELAANVTAEVHLYGVDSEGIRHNQRGEHVETVVLDVTASEPSRREVVSFCIDGELRLEQHLHAVLQFDGSVATTLEARLYEGTTCDTDDREDRLAETVTVPCPGSTSWRAGLVNRETRGGDRGVFEVDLTIASP